MQSYQTLIPQTSTKHPHRCRDLQANFKQLTGGRNHMKTKIPLTPKHKDKAVLRMATAPQTRP